MPSLHPSTRSSRSSSSSPSSSSSSSSTSHSTSPHSHPLNPPTSFIPHLPLLFSLLLLSLPLPSLSAPPGYYKWIKGSATFYGDDNGQGNDMGGACGYGNTYNRGYGLYTGAASQAIWFKGAVCGGCFQIQCHNSRWCLPGSPRLVITVTNNCPNNWAQANDAGGWCNYPRKHLDLAVPAFIKIAEYRGGIIPIRMRRVPCSRSGGLRLSVFGNPWFITVLVWNVAGAGDLRAISARVDGGNWVGLFRNWGATWTLSGGGYYGKEVHLRLRSGYTNEKLVIGGGLPSWWSFGGDYEAKGNYKVPSNLNQMLAGR